MAFRSIIIKERCKLECSLNYLICRKGTEETRVLIDEIKLIIIESTQVSITTSLIAKLTENKVKIIFCDVNHNPISEITPYQNNYYSYRKIKEQINFVNDQNDLWRIIIKEKILNQAYVLKISDHIEEYNMLMSYYDDVEKGDTSNREGHSAKVYFNALFGKDFNRRNEFDPINKYLNYGYSLILASINREIKALGYLTELGIHHIGESNPFNLSCDLIEPLRPLIDSLVVKKIVNEDNYKMKYLELLSSQVLYNDQYIFLDNAIHLYIVNIIDYMKTNDDKYLKFIYYEL